MRAVLDGNEAKYELFRDEPDFYFSFQLTLIDYVRYLMKLVFVCNQDKRVKGRFEDMIDT